MVGLLKVLVELRVLYGNEGKTPMKTAQQANVIAANASALGRKKGMG
jgi:hypothetical protein